MGPRPRIVFLAAGCLAALAFVLSACGGGGDSSGITGVTRVQTAACDKLEYGGEGQPNAVIVSDEPLQGDSAERSNQINDAIRVELDQADWTAGDVNLAFQACDDSNAKAGGWTPKICRDNATAYAKDPDVIGVIGTYNSGCAAEIIPILNKADVAMVSPGNTLICLTQPSDACPSGDPDVFYPTGTRNYARVVPNDAAQPEL